jgi:alkaline phosphatase D
MLSRRLFLAASGASLWIPTPSRAQGAAYPFTLGVASGCPRETSVVLWTRLAPQPLQGGGMPPGPTTVRWRLCRDAAMRDTVYDGLALTSDLKAHAVHVTVQGLEPGREYFYQFHYGEDDSPVGRTRTTSRLDQAARIAVANCQHYETGYYAAYADIAAWTPDCVVHLGDYIYEGGVTPIGARSRDYAGAVVDGTTVRSHDGPEIVTLWDYRNRYALYRSDLSLQAAHATAPWVVAMDDHEVDNNWAGDTPQDPEKQTIDEFRLRKRAAFQAYYEHMPLERSPTIGGIELYDSFRFGPAQVNLLDTRQFRSDQVCGDGQPGNFPCAAIDDPALTMTGAVQERWLVEQLSRSDAAHNVIALQTWFAPFRYVDGRADAPLWNTDQWDGYPKQRQRIIDALAAGVADPVVLSGDWHCAAAMRVLRDPADAASAPVGWNFAATSIASHCPWAHRVHGSKDANPHVAHVNGDKRGYLRCTADGGFTAEFRIVADPFDPQSAVSTDVEIRTSDA